jgi:hypothetical protein
MDVRVSRWSGDQRRSGHLGLNLGRDRATRVHCHRAKLHGVVTPDGSLTRWFFQYRRDSTSTWSNSASAYAGWGGTRVRVAVVLQDLRRRSTYLYRLVAINPGGRATGTTQIFSTRR